MADEEKVEDIQLLKSTKISVYVDEALQDMLVVTYKYGLKIYKGILLDYTKRNLPFGVSKLHPAFTTSNSKTNNDDDILYSVNQRFAYTDTTNLAKPKNVRIPSKYKNNKMTVRLRPRQVLCSKCKGICNENSENISKKRKLPENVQPPPSKRSANAPMTRSVYTEQLSKNKVNAQKLQPTLIPKLSRLLPQDISDALNGNLDNLNQTKDDLKKDIVSISSSNSKLNNNGDMEDLTNISSETITDKIDHSDQHSENSNSSQVANKIPVLTMTSQGTEICVKSIKRTLRKKRSVGSMEDLWDESVFEERVHLRGSDPNSNNGGIITENSNNNSNSCVSTRTIKISYGPQGEGTVLKIPAPLDKFNASDNSEENVNIGNQIVDEDNDSAKAARKALKRARKKARQKRLLSGNSPNQINPMSPRYTLGAGSPRYSIVGASPRHYIGSNSPRYVTSTMDLSMSKRHKHKLKRKKKHRVEKDRKHKDDDTSGQENIGKQQAVTQKLSINLKRLHNTYTSCSNTSDKGDENTSSSDDQNEQVPDFPPSDLPLLRVNAQTVTSASGPDGGRLLVGDVVWGKIQGFPWWPGKIITITCLTNQPPQAHVTWYGSSTSSLIQCDQLTPYLENFKVRYNKKKKGAYKEAIRQATLEASEIVANRLTIESPVESSPSQNIIAVPPPTLASPREIDVMS